MVSTRYKLLSVIGLLLNSALAEVVFTDITQPAGIHAITYAGSKEKKHLLESLGCGAAFLDYDNDGDQDLYLVNGWKIKGPGDIVRGSNMLYRNNGNGTFTNVTAFANVGNDNWGVGVCCGDYDNDGWVDLYVTNFGANCLYHNNHDGTFTDVAHQSGVANGTEKPGMDEVQHLSAGATFLDYDNDGNLDLYLVNYIDCTIEEVLTAELTQDWKGVTKVMSGPRGLKGSADVFYRNNGDGTFTNVTVEAGLIDIGELYGLGVCSTDLDLDGDIDLYVANDAGPNYLYQNNGNETFSEIGLYANAAVAETGLPQASMGVDFADYDNDGDPDGFLTHFSGECSTLYRNLGQGFFEDHTKSVGLWQPTYLPMSWGVSFFDYDNDTDLDLFIANGHIYPQVDTHLEYGELYAQPDQLFQNITHLPKEPIDGTHQLKLDRPLGEVLNFKLVTESIGLDRRLSSRGTAFADYDNDGDIDLLVTHMDAPPTLLRNDTMSNRHQRNWLLIDLEGTISNRSGVGSKIHVTVGNLTLVREVRSGSGYVSQNDLRAHFGLGEANLIDHLQVKWLSGSVSNLYKITPSQIIHLREPQD